MQTKGGNSLILEVWLLLFKLYGLFFPLPYPTCFFHPFSYRENILHFIVCCSDLSSKILWCRGGSCPPFQNHAFDRPVPSLKPLEEQVHLLVTSADGFHLRADGFIGPVVAAHWPKARRLWIITSLRNYTFFTLRERLGMLPNPLSLTVE